MSAFAQFRENERERRRDHIVASAIELFRKKSFHTIGMREIAKEAGISPASIYRYFPSQDDLYAEILLLRLPGLEQELKKYSKGDSLLTKKIAEITIGYFLTHDAEFQILCQFMLRKDLSEGAKAKFDALEKYYIRLLKKMTPDSERADGSRLLYPTILASLIGIAMVINNQPDLSREEIRQLIHIPIQLIVDGIQ